MGETRSFLELRRKLAQFPARFFRSPQGRSLCAKCLRQVRKVNGREAARVVQKDILFYSILPSYDFSDDRDQT